VGTAMSQRDSNLLWLKDIIEHLGECRQQLQWTQDVDTIHVVTETMLRDLECCRRICEALQLQATLQHAV
jgi:hypothetical protein